jgi:hypothetical protein
MLSAFLAKLEATAARPAEAVAVCDETLADAGGAGATDEAWDVAAHALFEKARALSTLGRARESDDVVDELVRRFEHATSGSRRTLVCRALLGRAKDRLASGRVDRRAITVEYRHALHIAERQPPVDAMAAAALFHLALTHAKIAVERDDADHRERAAARFAELAARFGASADPGVAHWLARGVECDALLRASR